MKTNTTQKLLQYLRTHKRTTAKKLTEFLSISKQALFKHHLTPLLQAGKIKKIGRPPTVYYSLLEEGLSLQKSAMAWAQAEQVQTKDLEREYYCETRDVFQGRLDKMLYEMIRIKTLPTDTVYLLTAVTGEIGNNSFDHNLGQWPDVPGIIFGYETIKGKATVILADRGQGVLTTLKKIRPALADDRKALEVAFTERVSGRSPEKRGNSLKYVRKVIDAQHMHLAFSSGSATAKLNDILKIDSTTPHIQGCVAIITT